jgi:hypothetical protein
VHEGATYIGNPLAFPQLWVARSIAEPEFCVIVFESEYLHILMTKTASISASSLIKHSAQRNHYRLEKQETKLSIFCQT